MLNAMQLKNICKRIKSISPNLEESKKEKGGNAMETQERGETLLHERYFLN